jgi:hypothetical protein
VFGPHWYVSSIMRHQGGSSGQVFLFYNGLEARTDPACPSPTPIPTPTPSPTPTPTPTPTPSRPPPPPPGSQPWEVCNCSLIFLKQHCCTTGTQRLGTTRKMRKKTRLTSLCLFGVVISVTCFLGFFSPSETRRFAENPASILASFFLTTAKGCKWDQSSSRCVTPATPGTDSCGFGLASGPSAALVPSSPLVFVVPLANTGCSFLPFASLGASPPYSS